MRTVAVAVVRGDVPTVLVAEDIDVLTRLVALHVVAQTDPRRFGDAADEVRDALLEERWADGVVDWIELSGTPIDVYTETVVSAEQIPAETIGAELQFAPLFREG